MTDRIYPLFPTEATAPEHSRASTYLVTGCAGFIGSHLTETLLQRGDAVIGIDTFTDYYPRALKHANLEHSLERHGFAFFETDLVSAPLSELLVSVDGIFHLAAQPGVRGSWGASFETYVHDNVLATQRVFQAAADAELRVVYASSSSIYGNALSLPTTEEAKPCPVSPYVVTKLCCEHLARAYELSLGLDAVGLRYFTVYGPRQRPDMAIQRIARALADGGGFSVFGTGEQSRDVTYVDDAVTATIATMEAAPGGGAYNVGGGSETSLRRIIELAQELTGEELDVTYGAAATGDVMRTVADTSRIRDDIGWVPQVELEDGLISQLAWAMSQVSWAEASAYAS
ncbi:MAG: NAD-dependent epimerase/dehydratase family protein [Solirubrobacteraceae bacterium]